MSEGTKSRWGSSRDILNLKLSLPIEFIGYVEERLIAGLFVGRVSRVNYTVRAVSDILAFLHTQTPH